MRRTRHAQPDPHVNRLRFVPPFEWVTSEIPGLRRLARVVVQEKLAITAPVAPVALVTIQLVKYLPAPGDRLRVGRFKRGYAYGRPGHGLLFHQTAHLVLDVLTFAQHLDVSAVAH
jgi:hypothetical protein